MVFQKISIVVIGVLIGALITYLLGRRVIKYNDQNERDRQRNLNSGVDPRIVNAHYDAQRSAGVFGVLFVFVMGIIPVIIAIITINQF